METSLSLSLHPLQIFLSSRFCFFFSPSRKFKGWIGEWTDWRPILFHRRVFFNLNIDARFKSFLNLTFEGSTLSPPRSISREGRRWNYFGIYKETFPFSSPSLGAIRADSDTENEAESGILSFSLLFNGNLRICKLFFSFKSTPPKKNIYIFHA